MKKQTGMIRQIYVLIIIGMVLIGFFTYYSQYRVTDQSVRTASENIAKEIALETISAVKEYPSSQWLLKYWYEHADEMDVEYDARFTDNTRTKEKYALFLQHQPAFQMKYATAAEAEALPEEDRKLFAEIVYSWVITRMDEIKQNLDVDHLFCVVVETDTGEHPYESLYFLLSGASETETRGSGKDEIFTLGTVVKVKTDSLSNALRNAVQVRNQSEGHFEYSGNYADYYTYLDTFEDHAVLAGVSYSNEGLKALIQHNAWANTCYSLVYEFVLLQILMTHLYVFGIRPLKNVTENIRLYGESKDSITVSNRLKENLKGWKAFATRQNEIGQLSEDFMALMKEVDRYVDEIEMITAHNQRIMTELNLASSIQNSMLPNKFPPFPERTEFSLYASMKPAREVAGDFYDFFLIDEDHLAVVIADVSGKGVPAALLMMVAMILIRNNAKMDHSPANVLSATNEALRATNEQEMFVTAWIGVLEISTGLMTCANAGHEYPILIHPEGNVELIHDKHGMVLGGMSGAKYKEYELQLKPASKLFVYTDGVPEAHNTDKQMYGTDLLMRILNNCTEQKPEELIGNVKATIEKFTGEEEQFDDMTMVCVEYNGIQNGAKREAQ